MTTDNPLLRSLQEARDALVALPIDPPAVKREFHQRVKLVQEASFQMLDVLRSLDGEADGEHSKQARAVMAETKKLVTKHTKLLTRAVTVMTSEKTVPAGGSNATGD